MAITDKLSQASSSNSGRPVTASLSGSGHTLGGTSITINDATNWSTVSVIYFSIYTTTTVGSATVKDTTSQTDWKGTLSGTTISNMTIVGGTDRDYVAGSIVELTPLARQWKDLYDWGTAEHKQTGAHSDVTADSITVEDIEITGDLTVTGSVAAGGWTPLGATASVSTGYNQSNKSFEIATSSDVSGNVSPGMRFKFGTSGFTVPTQCTDLEASSSQYWSKTSPSGINFTDDFTCEAWVKLESYSDGFIVSRKNGTTEGWAFYIDSAGRLVIQSLRIASNNRTVTTNQSLPLNRWVHVAATMDNSANTHTTYIDGVAVSNTVSTTGTITALVQGTTALAVGAQNTPTNYFDGKIADVRVWSAVRTATEIQDNMSKVLTGSETNLVAHFPMNGNGNDSTANANNLTGQASAVATNTDNPYNLNSGTHYGIITKVTTTAITVFTGTDSFVPNATLIDPYYSTQKVPFGFPAGRDKWMLETLSSSTASISTSWANVGSILLVLPIGSWELSSRANMAVTRSGSTVAGYSALSESATAVSAGYLSTIAYNRSNVEGGGSFDSAINKSFSSPTTVYQIHTGTITSGALVINNDAQHYIRAVCAYL